MTHKATRRLTLILFIVTISSRFGAVQAQPVNDPLYSQQSYLQTINIEDAWAVTTGDPSVTIGIIGGGNVLPGHEDLGAKTTVKTQGKYANGSLVDIPFDYQPTIGTAVAGVAAAITNNSAGIAGINRAAPILSYNPSTIPVDQAGDPILGLHVPNVGKVDDDVSDAVSEGANVLITPFLVYPQDWNPDLQFQPAPVATEVKVANTVPVIGGKELAGRYFLNEAHVLNLVKAFFLQDNSPYWNAAAAFRNALTAGVTTFAPAGDYDGEIGGVPAGLSDNGFVITVGSSDGSGDPYQYSASSTSDLDLVAPGRNARTTVNEMTSGSQAYGDVSGTAISAGLAGGVGSLLKSLKGSLKPEDIRQVLRRTVQDIGDPGRDAKTGFGRLDADAAVDYVNDNTFVHGTATNGTVVETQSITSISILSGLWGNLASGRYYTDEMKKVQFTVGLPDPNKANEYEVWVRLAGTTGWSTASPNSQKPWADFEIDQNAGTVTFSTWVYGEDLTREDGSEIKGWVPASPQNAKVAYTIAGPEEPPPPPPLDGGIVGPAEVAYGDQATWNAEALGGRSPYDYLWYLKEEGESSFTNTGVTSQSYSRYIDGGPDFELKVRIRDADGEKVFDTHSVTYSPCGGGGDEPPIEPSGPSCQREEDEIGIRAETARPVPEAFTLDSAAPNPMRSQATIRYGLPEQASVSVAVYDALGRRVATLAGGAQEAGWHTAQFEASDLPAGVYLVRMRAGKGFATTKRIVVAE